MGLATAIGLGVAGIGSAISSSNNRKAARRAAQQSQQATDQSIALQRESRDMAFRRLDPFGNRGNAAGNAINALLGLGGSEVMGGPARMELPMQPNALSQFQGGAGQPYGLGDVPMMGGQFAPFNAVAQGGAQPMTAQQAQENAFERFRNSTGYQFRLSEGQDALNSGFAGSGLLQSGAALRALDDYRQGMAASEFGNYMGMLGGQQAVGAGAGSALAGVGQNFAGTVIDSNNMNAQNQMAAQLSRQNPFGNALGVWGGSMQNVLGAAMGGGFGR